MIATKECVGWAFKRSGRTSQNEASNSRDEAREEGVEREGTNEHAIYELSDSSEEDVNQVKVHDFDLHGGVLVGTPQLRDNSLVSRHAVRRARVS